VSAVCGVVHYYWLVKSDVRKPVFYGALVGILLVWRGVRWAAKRGQSAPIETAEAVVPAGPLP